jgi:hypothetical protein
VKTSVTRGYRKTASRFDKSEKHESSLSRQEPSIHNTQIQSNGKLDQPDEADVQKERRREVCSVPGLENIHRKLPIQDTGRKKHSKGVFGRENGREYTATVLDGQREGKLSSHEGLQETSMTSCKKASSPSFFKEHDGEWVDVDNEDAFEFLGEEEEEAILDPENEWDVI